MACGRLAVLLFAAAASTLAPSLLPICAAIRPTTNKRFYAYLRLSPLRHIVFRLRPLHGPLTAPQTKVIIPQPNNKQAALVPANAHALFERQQELQRALQKAQVEVVELRHAVGSADALLVARDHAITALKQEHAEASRKWDVSHRQLSDRLHEAEATVDRLQASIHGLQAELDHATTTAEKHGIESAGLKEQLHALQAEKARPREEWEDVVSSLREAEGELIDYKARDERSRRVELELRGMLEEARREEGELWVELDASVRAVHDLSARLHVASAELVDTRSALERAQVVERGVWAGVSRRQRIAAMAATALVPTLVSAGVGMKSVGPVYAGVLGTSVCVSLMAATHIHHALSAWRAHISSTYTHTTARGRKPEVTAVAVCVGVGVVLSVLLGSGVIHREPLVVAAEAWRKSGV